MALSLLERAKSAMSSGGCAAALAIVPLATVAARPARATPIVLFGFDSSQTAVYENGTYLNVLSGGAFSNFGGYTESDGFVHITGSLTAAPMPAGTGGAFSQFDLHFGGGITGTPDPADVLGVVCALNASISASGGGTLSYAGLTFAAGFGNYLGDNGDDTASPPVFTGSSINVIDDVTSGVSFSSGGGYTPDAWVMDVYLDCSGFSAGDTLNLTVPDNSIDFGDITSVPEPAACSLLAVPALLSMRRRSRRNAASG